MRGGCLAAKDPNEAEELCLSEIYQMPDDRVSIHGVPADNVGHTPLLEVTFGERRAVQSGPAEGALC